MPRQPVLLSYTAAGDDDGMLDVTMQIRSVLTGVEHERTYRMTEDQLEAYRTGSDYVQNIFPELTAPEREFLISGITEAEWRAHFEWIESP